MSALVDDAMMARTFAEAGLSMKGARPGPAALASPSYWALESRSVLTDAAFVKRMHPEMAQDFDLGSAIQAVRQAGEAGVGPRVIWSDPETGAVAMDTLADGWSTADQASLQRPTTVASAMAALKVVHEGAALPGRFDPFSQIDRLIAEFGHLGAALPDDMTWLRRLAALIEPLAEVSSRAPCRNDGSSSNLMLGPADQVLLVDFDRAGMNDPLYDVGCLLAEVTDFERDMHAGYVAYAGSFDAPGFARARLWSHVDDLLHAIWSRLKARTSVRGGIEWLKYGEWRLMRARMALMHPQFEEKLRIAGETA